MIPRSLEIEVHCNQNELPLRGGFADVWKGQHDGREVAVKVLRVYFTSDFEQIRRVSCPQLVVCIDGQTVSHTEVLWRGCDMEGPSSSKCVATVGGDDD
jgi:hypothetical protein